MVNTRKIRGLRVEHGFTQTQVAKKLNVALTSYSNKETGKTSFTIEELSTLTKLFSVKIEDVLM